MSQVTIYLDRPTELLLKDTVKRMGMSVSKWIAQLIKKSAGDEWPDEIKKLAGSWPDFPDAETLRAEYGKDCKREEL